MLADDGNVVFDGRGPEAQQGIYLKSGGELHKIIDVGDDLPGGTPVALRIGTDALSGDKIAFLAIFDDGSQEIYTAAFQVVGNLPGDLNGDGEVNFGDLVPFPLGLTDVSAYEAAYPDVDRVAAGDINMDGAFNFGDLQAFVDLLTGGVVGGSTVPEPSVLLLLLGFIGIGVLRRPRWAHE